MKETEDRFKFGDNWNDYAHRLGPEDYAKAKASVVNLVPDLTGQTFLDVGCGSGLFSIAASACGATQVRGIDIDATCVETARFLLDRSAAWDSEIRKENVSFAVESILHSEEGAATYDVVYSWGVLHHTGDMAAAFEAIKERVAPGGRLVIAIYNRHFTAPLWKVIKWFYVKSPRLVQKLLVWLVYGVKLLAAFVVTRQNPFTRRRGMHYYYDIVDWVGGYPYEYASIEEITRFFEARGFACVKTNPTRGWTGCNEFVLERKA